MAKAESCHAKALIDHKPLQLDDSGPDLPGTPTKSSERTTMLRQSNLSCNGSSMWHADMGKSIQVLSKHAYLQLGLDLGGEPHSRPRVGSQVPGNS